MSEKTIKLHKTSAREVFSAKNITRMAVFTALSVILYLWVKFPLPIFPSWLDVQVSELPALLAGYMMGPWYGAVVIVLKCVIKMPMTSTACVGELGDILIGISFVLPACYFYKHHRTLKGAIASLAIGVGVSTGISIIVNWLVLIPLYVEMYFGGNWDVIVGMLSELFPGVTRDTFYTYYLLCGVLPFNVFRGGICAVLTFLLYKHLERFFNYIFRKDRHSRSCGVKKYIVNSPKAMISLGRKTAKDFTGGEVILLTGELGAGKTVFCKGVAKGLGIDASVVSPTFTIMNEYPGEKIKFCHFDAYRLSGSDEAIAAGIAEYIGAKDTVCAVEWWENIDEMFDGCRTVKVEISRTENGREVVIWR